MTDRILFPHVKFLLEDDGVPIHRQQPPSPTALVPSSPKTVAIRTIRLHRPGITGSMIVLDRFHSRKRTGASLEEHHLRRPFSTRRVPVRNSCSSCSMVLNIFRTLAHHQDLGAALQRRLPHSELSRSEGNGSFVVSSVVGQKVRWDEGPRVFFRGCLPSPAIMMA